jgi:hypothetical protein
VCVKKGERDVNNKEGDMKMRGYFTTCNLLITILTKLRREREREREGESEVNWSNIKHTRKHMLRQILDFAILDVLV